MSVKNSNELGKKLLEILAKNRNSQSKLKDTSDSKTSNAFCFSNIVQMPLEKGHSSKLLNFSNHSSTPSQASSVVVNNNDNDYDGMLTSLFDYSDSEISLASWAESDSKKATIVAVPYGKLSPDPNVATFANILPTEKQLSLQKSGSGELYQTQKTTMPTEADAFEIDLSAPDPMFYEPEVSHSIFSTKQATEPTRIYCDKCDEAVNTAVSLAKRPLWREILNSMNCCSNPFGHEQEVIHSCPRCGDELRRVNCRL